MQNTELRMQISDAERRGSLNSEICILVSDIFALFPARVCKQADDGPEPRPLLR